jgi:hypothetical protein
VILQQTHAAAILFVRRGPDWLSEIGTGPDAVLDLPEIGIDLPLAEIYASIPVRDDTTDDPVL